MCNRGQDDSPVEADLDTQPRSVGVEHLMETNSCDLNRQANIKHKSPNRMTSLRRIVSFLIPVLLLFATDAVQANRAQERLCNVGLSLGGAYGRLKFFGGASGGRPPPDQVAAIATNLRNAAAEIRAFNWEAAFINPIHTKEQLTDSRRNIIDKLTRLSGTARTLTSNDAPRISEIRSQFQDSIAYFSTSENQRGFVRGENCDTELLDACYHFAAAQIAAFFAPQHHHVGMMRRAIQDGIRLSFDNTTRGDPANDAFDPNTTLCCNFGTRADWAPILALDANSTSGNFNAQEGYLRRMVFAIPIPFCGKKTWVKGKWITWWDYYIRQKGWTPIGRVNRFCRRELACIDKPSHPNTLPECDSSREGVVIQNRVSHNGCIAQGCEGGTQRISRDKDGKPVAPYDAIFETYVCRSGASGSTVKGADGSVPKRATGMWYKVQAGPYGGGKACLTEKGVARVKHEGHKITPMNESCDSPSD
jgi:hypothetical protein